MTKREKQLVEALREMITVYDRRVDSILVPWYDKVIVGNARELLKQYEPKQEKQNDRN